MEAIVLRDTITVHTVWSGEIRPEVPYTNGCNLILPHPVYCDSTLV